MEEPNALMRWLIFHFAGGDALLIALLAGAILSIWPGDVRNPWRGTLITFILVVWGGLSSPAWPLWGMLAFLGVVFAWRIAIHRTPAENSLSKRLGLLFQAALITAGLAELSAGWSPSPTVPDRLDVIADSITAGLNDGEITWPRLFAEKTGIPVRDASQPGATLKSALKQAESLGDDNPVILEIGGNDLLSGLPVHQFATDCEALLKQVCTPGRTVWMTELPLLPLCSRYGEVQRRLCRRYGARLIPKRRLMTVLTTKGGTVDSIHLSRLGQELLCQTILRATGISDLPRATTPDYQRIDRTRNGVSAGENAFFWPGIGVCGRAGMRYISRGNALVRAAGRCCVCRHGIASMKIRSRLLTRWISWFIVRVSELLFRTCKLVFIAPEPWLHLNHIAGPEDPRRGVMCVWHDLLVIPTIAVPPAFRRRTCCLVSKHQDGSYLAEAMDFLGYTTVRGSTRRGGAGALKQLLADTAGKHIVITPDGPRGPRRQLKPGAVYVASQTGRILCPGAFACKSAWKIPGSWTDMVIPKPFTTVYLVTGSPLHIPADLTREQLDQCVDQMQRAMDLLSDQVERLARGEIEAITFDPPAESPSRIAA